MTCIAAAVICKLLSVCLEDADVIREHFIAYLSAAGAGGIHSMLQLCIACSRGVASSTSLVITALHNAPLQCVPTEATVASASLNRRVGH